MRKAKRHFKIYLVETYDTACWDGNVSTSKRYIGDTWAVSEDQAVNNMRYRKDCYAYQAVDLGGDTAYFGELVAEEVAPSGWTYRPGYLEKAYPNKTEE